MDKELETLKRAKSYIAALAEGVDPLTGQTVEDDSVLNNPRIIRCLYYVSSVLDKVIENGGQVTGPVSAPVQKKKIKRERPFSLTEEQLDTLAAEPKKISITALLSKANDLIPEDMKKLSYKQASGWLISQEMMRQQTTPAGRNIAIPTETGERAGIVREQLMGKFGPYMANLLTTDGQIFLLEHPEEIARFGEIDPETGEIL